MTTDIPKPLRYLRILHYLSTHRQATIADLYSHFNQETSVRNLQRDLKDLMKLEGIHIEVEVKGRTAIYSIPREFRGSYRVPIEQKELSALLLVRRLAQTLRGTQLAKDTDKLMQKIGQWVTPEGDQDFVTDLDELVLLGPKKRTAVSATVDIISPTLEAIRTKRVLEVRYERGDIVKFTVEVCPLRILHHKANLYILGFVPETPGRIITFRFDRIHGIVLTKTPFTISDETSKNLEKRLKTPFGLFYDESLPIERIELLFEADVAGQIEKQVFHETQVIKKNRNGSLTVTMDVPVDTELFNWIVSWGDCVIVKRPESLRKMLRTLGESYIKSYPDIY